MEAPQIAGAAWREAQFLVGRLAHTRPLPQLTTKQQTPESILQRQQARKKASESSARHIECACKAHDRQQPLRRIDVGADSDVDSDLWEVLELATEDELESIHGILYGGMLFSPDLVFLVPNKSGAKESR